MNTGPGWATPAGFLFTATENVSTSFALVAIGQSLTYSVSLGELPEGITLTSHGDIIGTPGPVQNKTRYQFIVRAAIPAGVSDRLFSIDVDGKTTPYFIDTNITVSNGNKYLNIGPNGETWALNNQYVNFSIVADADPALTPLDTVFNYYIGDAGGQLPPGLSLSTDGVISGFINDNLTLETQTSAPKVYKFTVTVTDGVASASGTFNILVVDPTIIQNPYPYVYDLDPGILYQDATYLPPLQFIKGTELGIVKAQNDIILNVGAHDPYPETPFVTYVIGTGTTLPPYLNIENYSGKLYGYIPYQPAYTREYTIRIDAIRSQFATNLNSESTSLDTATFTLTAITTISSNIFSLTIEGDTENPLEWISTGSLGDIVIGEIS
jgi:hypothetical protein